MRHPDRCGKGEPQSRFLDLFAEAFQRRVRVLELPADGRAESRARPPEEVEGIPAVAAAAIELGRERRDIDPVRFIQRHGKTEQGQLPGTEQLVMVLD